MSGGLANSIATLTSIVQDISLFKIPEDLDNLASVLVGILEGVEA